MKIGTSNIHNAIKFTVSIAYDAYVDILKMKIGTSNIHNAIKFTVSIAYDAYVDIFYG